MINPDYIRWIKTRDCSVRDCHYQGIMDAHHRIGHNRREDYANKTSDGEAIPLCPPHHDELHAHGWQSFEIKYNLNQLKTAIKMLIRYVSLIESIQDSPI